MKGAGTLKVSRVLTARSFYVTLTATLPPSATARFGFAMTSQYDHAIRELIQLIVSQRDSEKLRELASALELLLKLEARAARDSRAESVSNIRAAGS